MKFNKYGNYKENTIMFFNRMSHKKHGDSYKHYTNILSWCKEFNFKNILDLGTGKGCLIGLLKEIPENKDIKAYGIDISEGMIGEAISSQIDAAFSVGDSEMIDFEDEFFDLVTCVNSFHHYDNPLKSANEISRVLKPNGTLILGEIFLPLGLHKLVNFFLPYGTTGDYKIYSGSELKRIFGDENLHLVRQEYVFPSIKTYMFKKKEKN